MLNQIPKTADEFHNQINDMLYFIVHPEQLDNENSTLLHEFITTRIRSTEINLPKVIIISSDYRFFESPDSIDESVYQKCKIDIDDNNEIQIMCKLSYQESSKVNSYLYYSEEAGSGKTYHIQKDMLAQYSEKKSRF